MKYPLKVVKIVEQQYELAVADASGKLICAILDKEWGHRFAASLVRWANRWHHVRCWFRPYTRNDWLNEVTPRNSIRVKLR